MRTRDLLRNLQEVSEVCGGPALLDTDEASTSSEDDAPWPVFRRAPRLPLVQPPAEEAQQGSQNNEPTPAIVRIRVEAQAIINKGLFPVIKSMAENPGKYNIKNPYKSDC